MLPTSLPPFPPALRVRNRAQRVSALRAALAGPGPLLLPGVTTALTAVQAEQVGFVAGYLTGAGLANVEYALPDIGLVGLAEVAAQTRRVTAATVLPMIVDADTGYGGPLGVVQTVRELESAGAAGIQLEDQEWPKRCGHFDRKRVVEVDEMVAKVRAAVATRTDGTVLVARTDAVAVEGTDAAVLRARAYREAGADILFVEALRSRDELAEVAKALAPATLLANVVEGGRTPPLDAATFAALGYRVVLFANAVNRVMAKAAATALSTLLADGGTQGLHDAMLGWTERQALVGLDLADALEDQLRATTTTARSDDDR